MAKSFSILQGINGLDDFPPSSNVCADVNPVAVSGIFGTTVGMVMTEQRYKTFLSPLSNNEHHYRHALHE